MDFKTQEPRLRNVKKVVCTRRFQDGRLDRVGRRGIHNIYTLIYQLNNKNILFIYLFIQLNNYNFIIFYMYSYNNMYNKF